MNAPESIVSTRCPAIDSEKLDRYRALITAVEHDETRNALTGLALAVDDYLLNGDVQAAQRYLGTIVPVFHGTVQFNIPTDYYRQGELFEALTGDVRTAAFHLRWYGYEFAQGRVPQTI